MANGRLPKPRPEPIGSQVKKAKIEVKESVLPNARLFAQKLTGQILSIASDGIKTNLLEDESDAIDAADICMGLDFGTSSVKVVISDANRKVHYAIPFFEIGTENPYIFPSHVFLKSDEYSLSLREAASDAACIRDIKITLIEVGEDSQYMAHATAFLALIIRHARGWLFATHGDVYRNSEINWSVNLGLPAEKSENTSLEKRFRLVALASSNLAGYKGKVTVENAEKYLRLATLSLRSSHIASDEMSVHPDMVAVYPEIAAQVVAFVESEKWDAISRPFITMIDIGAGTVDVSFFSVEAMRGRKFRFFASKVSHNGVANLHRARTAWLKTNLREQRVLTPELTRFLEEISRPTDRTVAIPELVQSYVSGIEVDDAQSIDTDFFEKRYRYQVFAEVINPVKRCRVPVGQHWEALPVFVCGGGSRMDFYAKIIQRLNNIQGINWLKAERYRLTRPKKLEAPGLPDDEYDRLSVAYGLSFEKVGEIIKSAQIPDFVRNPLPVLDVEMISKDYC